MDYFFLSKVKASNPPPTKSIGIKGNFIAAPAAGCCFVP
jgi:hypothetical protein